MRADLVKTTTGLYLLACQALPALCKKYSVRNHFKSDIYIPDYTEVQMKSLEARRMKALSILFEQFGVTWWEVFENSDIGKERLNIASRFVSSHSRILDVGCGRGFFSFACARMSGQLTCIDLMDGLGRKGWWDEFKRTAILLGVSERVQGLRSSGADLPVRPGSFDVVSSVHAIRNFRETGEILRMFREARNALRRGGWIIIAESRMDRSRCTAYGSFYSLRIKLGWEMGMPSGERLVRWLKETGFRRVSVHTLELGLKYAPVFFPFDEPSMGGMEEEYESARRTMIAEGEIHPPILLITAVK